MSTDTGKVVVNRAMSLDGFIAGPGHTEASPDGLAWLRFLAQGGSAAPGTSATRSVCPLEERRQRRFQIR